MSLRLANNSSKIRLGGLELLRSAYNPLALDPMLALDPYLSGSSALATGGGDAGYLDAVATFANAGNGSDATQVTGASQPVYLAHTGRNYAHLPGITGNTLSVPMAAGTYDYTITYVDDTTATGTVAEAGGVVTIGPTGANFANKQIWKISLSQSSVEQALFEADGASHKDVSYTDSYSKVWTVNRTGLNPAAIIGHPVVRLDGVDDFLSGTFASAINGGRMFAVFSVLGAGGEGSGRVFSIAASPGTDTQNTGWLVSGNNAGGLSSYYSSLWRTTHSAGFTGRLLHDISSFPYKSLRNDADLQTNAIGPTAFMASTRFAIGGPADGGNANTAIDLEALYLFPPTMTDAQAARHAAWLNNRLEIY